MTITPQVAAAIQQFRLPDKLGFGAVNAPVMFSAEWQGQEWGPGQLLPYGPIEILPGARALQYGELVFEGLKAYKIGQSVRDDGPQSHLTKAGTPTMGGALILVSIGITTLLWGDLSNRFLWAVLVVTLGFGAIGWVDDYRKVVEGNPKGLSARTKLLWQSVIGLIAAVYLAFAVSAPSNAQIFDLFTAWVGSGARSGR